ncbi:MAG: RHS repeat-associated core domain-containing protein, partial [Pseudomonadales bacterium]|nr:RHS repeat-associated core domain-containing protein [Pseudomonadales bacterium]
MKRSSLPEYRSYEIAYDNVGNIDQVTDWLRLANGDTLTWDTDYTHDASHRLTQSDMTRKLFDYSASSTTTDSVKTNTYAYDTFNNLKELTDPANDTYYYAHDDAHQLLRICKNDSTCLSTSQNIDTANTFDLNGNQLTRTRGSEVLSMSYDELDRMTQASINGGTETFKYDYQDRRIEKNDGTDTYYYHQHGLQVAGEYKNSWTSTPAQHAYGPYDIDMPIARSKNGTVDYFHQDYRNSVVMQTSANGDLNGWKQFGDWGDVSEEGGNYPPMFGFAGREHDDSGLIHMRARNYDPSQQRFTQRDPLGFIDGINRYTYVMNSPVLYIDPMGTNTNTGNTGAGNDTDNKQKGEFL